MFLNIESDREIKSIHIEFIDGEMSFNPTEKVTSERKTSSFTSSKTNGNNSDNSASKETTDIKEPSAKQTPKITVSRDDLLTNKPALASSDSISGSSTPKTPSPEPKIVDTKNRTPKVSSTMGGETF